MRDLISASTGLVVLTRETPVRAFAVNRRYVGRRFSVGKSTNSSRIQFPFSSFSPPLFLSRHVAISDACQRRVNSKGTYVLSLSIRRILRSLERMLIDSESKGFRAPTGIFLNDSNVTSDKEAVVGEYYES